MLAWMLYVIMVTLLLSVGAYVAERAARLKRAGTRWIWITAIAASLLIPTVIASVSVQLPNVLSPTVAQKMVVLREVTTQALSPVTWISGGAAEPRGWRDFDGTVTTLWRAASAAMLLALIVSGLHLALRKRRWRAGNVAGANVLVTDEVGPAVVGLLRSRIVVPRWVTLAPPAHQAAVIAHEQSHLDARDPQLFTFALTLLVLMPWNLPLWWQLRRLRYAIEVDCDSRVLRGGIDPAHYGETLISVGERQSAYIGAVAAMSESKSFLEERIRIMISKPGKWRRVGFAALASLSIGLTALAAQVSPPNATDPPAAEGGANKTGERVAIALPASTLDRYVGVYKLDDLQTLTVSRKGTGLQAQVTAQGAAEIFAENETSFFYKIVNAQIDFVAEAGVPATSLVLHQNGAEIAMPRLDDATASQLKANLAARISSNVAAPGSEVAVRSLAEGIAAGSPNYDEMEPMLGKVVRDKLSYLQQSVGSLGAIQSVEFVRVGDGGWDVYRIKYAGGTLMWRITMAPNGKVAMALALPDA